MVGSVEFAEDRDRLRWAISTYRQLEENNNMTRIIFPWILTPMFLKNIYLAARLYLSYMSVIKRRQASGQRRDDATQYLLDRGDEPANIIKVSQLASHWMRESRELTQALPDPDWCNMGRRSDHGCYRIVAICAALYQSRVERKVQS